MLNMLQKGAYQSWKFLQKQTPRTSKRSLLQLKSKSPAQFYSSSTKILKPKRTVEFKKNTNLHNQKRWKRITISTSKTKTFPRVERERETLPNAINDEDILALVVNNSLPCNCLDCHDVSEDRNNFEPMVFTHSTPMKMNETSAQVDNIPDVAQGQDSRNNLEGEGNSTSTSSSSDEFILHGPAKTFFPTMPRDGCCVFGDCEASPILDKKVIQPDSNFISSLQSLYEEEESRDSNEKQDDDIGISSSIQNEEKTFSNLSVEDDDQKKAEVDEETHDLEKSSRATSSSSFIDRCGQTLSSDDVDHSDDEDDNSNCSQEGDVIAVNSQFTEIVLRRPKKLVKKEFYKDTIIYHSLH